MIGWVAPLPIAVPWAAAALVLLFDRVADRRLTRLLTGVAVAAEVAGAAALLHHAGAHPAVMWVGGWAPVHGVALGISLTLDRLGAGAALGAGVAVAAAVALIPATLEDAGTTVDALLLVLLGAMAGFCLTGDLLTMLVFFELTAVASIALTAYDTGSVAALRSALSLGITSTISAFLGVMGIALIYARTGALNLAQIARAVAADPRPDRVIVLALGLLSAAFLIRAAIVPFHLWFVDTISASPLPVVIVLGGVLGTLGLLGVVRLWPAVSAAAGVPARGVADVLVVAGAATALVGGLLGLGFTAARRRLAFVIVAQTGITLVGAGLLSAGGLGPAILYSAGSGLAVGALACGLAVLDLARPRAGAALLVAGGLAVAGLPVLAPGLALQRLERAARGAGYPWVVPVVALAAAMAGGAVLRMARSSPQGGQPEATRRRVAGAVGIGAVLLVLAVLAGAAGGWTGAAGGWTAAAAAGAAGTAPAAVPITLGGTLVDLLSVAGALLLGSGYGSGFTRRLGRQAAVASTWSAVRRLHDGSIGDAVAWATIGTAAITLALASAMR